MITKMVRWQGLPRISHFLLALLSGVFLAALLLAADLALTASVQRRIAEEISDAVGGTAVVELGGWPLSPRILQGVIPRARIEIEGAGLPGSRAMLRSMAADLTDVTVERRRDGRLVVAAARGGRVDARLEHVAIPGTDAVLRALDVRLPDVRADLRGFSDPDEPVVLRSASGRFVAQLGEADANRLLGVPGVELSVLDGALRVSAGQLAIDGTASVADGAIRVELRPPPLVALFVGDIPPLVLRPELPGDARLEHVALRRGVVELRGVLTALELPAIGTA